MNIARVFIARAFELAPAHQYINLWASLFECDDDDVVTEPPLAANNSLLMARYLIRAIKAKTLTDADIELYAMQMTSTIARMLVTNLAVNFGRWALVLALTTQWSRKYPMEPYWTFYRAYALMFGNPSACNYSDVWNAMQGSTAQEAVIRKVAYRKNGSAIEQYVGEVDALYSAVDAVLLLAKYDYANAIELMCVHRNAPKAIYSPTASSTASRVLDPDATEKRLCTLLVQQELSTQQKQLLFRPRVVDIFYRSAVLDCVSNLPPECPTMPNNNMDERDQLLKEMNSVTSHVRMLAPLDMFLWTQDVLVHVKHELDLLKQSSSNPTRLWPDYVVRERAIRTTHAMIVTGSSYWTPALHCASMLDCAFPRDINVGHTILSAMSTAKVMSQSCARSPSIEAPMFKYSPRSDTMRTMATRLVSHGYILGAQMSSLWVTAMMSQSFSVQKLALTELKQAVSLFTASNAMDVYTNSTVDFTARYQQSNKSTTTTTTAKQPAMVVRSLSDITTWLQTAVSNLEASIVNSTRSLVYNGTIAKRRVVYQHHRLCRLVPYNTAKTEQQMGWRLRTVLKIIIQTTQPLFGDSEFKTRITLAERKLIEDRAMDMQTLAYTAAKEMKIVLDRMFNVVKPTKP
jgi:hypothetical protein